MCYPQHKWNWLSVMVVMMIMMAMTMMMGHLPPWAEKDESEQIFSAEVSQNVEVPNFFDWNSSRFAAAKFGKKVTDFETDKKAEGRCSNKQKSSFRCFSEARTDNALTAKMPQKKTNCHLKNQAKRREKIGFNCHKLRGDNLHNFHMCSWPICLALHASRLLFALAQQMTLLTLCVCPSLFPRFFLACV